MRGLSASEGRAILHAYLDQGAAVGEVGKQHAATTSRVIRAAVRAGLRDEHTRAVRGGQMIVGVSGAAGVPTLPVLIGDLAGCLVADVECPVFSRPWESVVGPLP